MYQFEIRLLYTSWFVFLPSQLIACFCLKSVVHLCINLLSSFNRVLQYGIKLAGFQSLPYCVRKLGVGERGRKYVFYVRFVVSMKKLIKLLLLMRTWYHLKSFLSLQSYSIQVFIPMFIIIHILIVSSLCGTHIIYIRFKWKSVKEKSGYVKYTVIRCDNVRCIFNIYVFRCEFFKINFCFNWCQISWPARHLFDSNLYIRRKWLWKEL